MRKVIGSEFVRLDGVVEDPGGAEGFEHGGWDAHSSARKRLASGLFPSWSPDGERIVYTAYAGERPYLAVINSDGSGRRSLGARCSTA